MSEAVNNNVLSRVGDDSCIATDSSNKEKHQNNNDCGLSKKYTISISTNSNDDEIIEEGFDYSEADLLDELNASDNHNDVNGDVERNANIQTYNSHHLPITQDAEKKGEERANITGTFSLNDHVSDINSHDNKARSTNVVASVFDSDCVPIVSTDNAPTSASDKQKVTPTNLVLCADTDKPNARVDSVDSYCPITPRRIVDVEAEPNSLLKSSSTTRIESNNKNVVDDAGIAGNNDHCDDGYYYSDEPEDELIVQFLGEANRIVSKYLH